MKKNKLFMAAAFAAAGAYAVIQGKGIFNKPRFREQHDAISRYVHTRYPHATYSPIEATQSGWATIIKRINKPKILLYVTRSDDGVYIFHETSE
ncbi:MAG: hypothetical protein ACI4C7_10290 [Clostridia bacterium]|nr:hypothetical protein [Clostridia bacterium]